MEKGRGKTSTTILKTKSPETQELTVILQWKEWLATNPDGKLPTNQKIEGQEDPEKILVPVQLCPPQTPYATASGISWNYTSTGLLIFVT